MNEKEKIRDYIQKNISILDDVVVGDRDNIFELGFVDSMFAMKLVNFVEREFGTILTNEDLSLLNFSTVENMYGLLMRKRSNE